MSFKISSLALAVATLSTVSIANAAGLDRSTQPSWAFTEEGTFAYVEHITMIQQSRVKITQMLRQLTQTLPLVAMSLIWLMITSF